MKYLFGLITILLTLNCNNKSEDDTSDCLNVACTEEFRTITISVKDEEGDAVVLEDFKVVILPQGEDITIGVSESSYGWMMENGIYPLFSDKYSAKYRNKKLEINFKGYIGDVKVVEADYTVGADCCHVLLFEGETNLVIRGL